MEFSEVIKNRYSCKKFDSRQIEKEQLDQILEAGTFGSYCQKSSGAEDLCSAVSGGAGKDR